jgi:hypothetical protein
MFPEFNYSTTFATKSTGNQDLNYGTAFAPTIFQVVKYLPIQQQ